MPTDNVARRAFLTGATALTAASYSRILGANDSVQLGVIGSGERGRFDMSQFMVSPTVDVGGRLRRLRRADR